MNTLVVYSSRTGNTRAVAEKIAEVVSPCESAPVEKAPDPEAFDFICLGFWVDRGQPDAKSLAYLKKTAGKTVALFGTLGASPESAHGVECRRAGEEAARQGDNKVLGTFLCQGRVDPKILEVMRAKAAAHHVMTAERQAMLKEGEKHPDEEDFRKAKEAFAAFLRQARG
jgi:flavodoxin